MKKLIAAAVACSFLFISQTGMAQTVRVGNTAELGFSIGSSTFLGELGGTRDIGRGFIYDLDINATRPVIGIYFRKSITPRFAFRLNGYFAQVSGDDNLATFSSTSDGGFDRWYRQLNFKSHIAELSAMIEYHILPYVPGNLDYRFTPYLLVGVGAFNFDPRGRDENGNYVRLQPLGTEGQGLAQYPEKDKYSLIGIAFPFGGGLKYNVSKKFSLGIEVAHRMTNTDYIDDVSTTYVDPAFFYAQDVASAPVREYFADPSSGDIPEKTGPGEQRGDPSDNDGYTFAGLFSMTYIFKGRSGNGKLYCPKGF